MSRMIYLNSPWSRKRAIEAIIAAEDGDVAKIGKETRTDAQNRKLHPMIDDIRRQVSGMETFTREDIKLRFLNALGTELRFLPVLEGEGMFPVGHRSSTLTKDQFSGLLELLYAYGAKHGVRWSDPQEIAA